ncbi:amidase [Nocardia sp. CDC160]|uniref:amidase n=1 Tax=Nocardia sp. CDC160 TaxID=3112166 RepID=UPI002DBB9725|nr:amidase [Nocardia sp. CDC160]MEC3919220.1 amidase [Nocardia sp. CDC160]
MTGTTTNSLLDGYFAGQSLITLGHDLRSARTTSAELVEYALQSIARIDPIVNAFVSVNADAARAAARAADAELSSGLDRGPLHGIPVAVKDLIDIAGLPTSCGSATSFGGMATHDAEVVTRLRDQGAVIIGKTTLHEFAYGATGDRSVHGPSRNPHDPSRMSGGSSGGSAVAVAAGMVPLSLGTDTAGSVRVPAALCGVVGFKPAYDAIPSSGVYPLAPTLDHIGLFARSVEDALLGYRALTDRPVDTALHDDSHSLTIGWIPAKDVADSDPRIEALAHDLLTRVGFVPDTVHGFPGWKHHQPLFEVFTTLQSKEAYEVHQHHLDHDRNLIDPEVLARLDSGRKVSTSSYATAHEARGQLRSTVQELLQAYGLLALPTVPVVAPPLGARSVHIGSTELEVRSALLSLTSPWNMTGTPAISIPVGTCDGLPTAVQLIASAGDEHLMFAAAQALESAAR